MKALLTVLFLMQLNTISHAKTATSGSMSQLLEERIKNCKNNFEGEQPEKLVMDAKNGYAHVSGGYPTCGCPCSSTAAYFKSNKGMVYLSYETDGCNFDYMFRSNKKIEELLPKNTLELFGLDQSQVKGYKPSLFYLEPTIPQKGTNLKVTIKPIPLGIKMQCSSGLCFDISQPTKKIDAFMGLYDLRKLTKDSSFFTDITKGKLQESEKLNKWLMTERRSKDDLVKFVKHAHILFKQMQKLKTDSLTFKWNRKDGKFEFLKTEPLSKPKSKDFEEFMQKAPAFFPAC